MDMEVTGLAQTTLVFVLLRFIFLPSVFRL